jgi:hypothetical protein
VAGEWQYTALSSHLRGLTASLVTQRAAPRLRTNNNEEATTHSRSPRERSFQTIVANVSHRIAYKSIVS